MGKGQKAFGTILINEKQWVGALPCHFVGVSSLVALTEEHMCSCTDHPEFLVVSWICSSSPTLSLL